MRKPTVSVTKKDLEVTWFSGSGAGGQHRNKHQNCCRIRHPASGALATGQESRSRIQNQKTALRRLAKTPKFLRWLDMKHYLAVNDMTMDEMVDAMLQPDMLRVEVQRGGKWEVTT